jgi:type VI protein secretion system component VasK
MAQISNALFETGKDEPEFNFTLRLPAPANVSQIDASIAGSSVTWTRTNVPTGVFTWGGSVTAGAQIRARIGDEDVTVANQPPGVWSVFRLFAAATRYQRASGSTAQVTWTAPGRNVPIVGELTMTSGFHLLEPGMLNAVGRCVSRIAR